MIEHGAFPVVIEMGRGLVAAVFVAVVGSILLILALQRFIFPS